MRFIVVAIALLVSVATAAPTAVKVPGVARSYDEDETGWFVAIPNLMAGMPEDA